MSAVCTGDFDATVIIALAQSIDKDKGITSGGVLGATESIVRY